MIILSLGKMVELEISCIFMSNILLTKSIFQEKLCLLISTINIFKVKFLLLLDPQTLAIPCLVRVVEKCCKQKFKISNVLGVF